MGFCAIKKYPMTYTLIGFNEKGENLVVPMVNAIAFLKDPKTEEYVHIGLEKAAWVPSNRVSLVSTFQVREKGIMLEDVMIRHNGRPRVESESENGSQSLNLRDLGRYVGARMPSHKLIEALDLSLTNVENVLREYNCFWLNNPDGNPNNMPMDQSDGEEEDWCVKDSVANNSQHESMRVSSKEMRLDDLEPESGEMREVTSPRDHSQLAMLSMISSNQKRAKEYKEPEERDVLYGQGTGPNIHNTWYREMFLRKHHMEYRSYGPSKRAPRKEIVNRIIDGVTALGGKFLIKDDDTGWYEADRKKTDDKIRKSLIGNDPLRADIVQKKAAAETIAHSGKSQSTLSRLTPLHPARRNTMKLKRRNITQMDQTITRRNCFKRKLARS